MTNDLIRRVAEHRVKRAKSFTKKYGVLRLVYFEQFDDAENAIRREKVESGLENPIDRGTQSQLG